MDLKAHGTSTLWLRSRDELAEQDLVTAEQCGELFRIGARTVEGSDLQVPEEEERVPS
jgi:hypothetical protein